MEELLNAVVSRIGDWDPLWAYAFLLLSAFLENVLPPVPGDTVVLFSAFLVGRGVFDWAPVYAVTCAGGLCGFAVVYVLGITKGRAFIEGPGRRFFSAEALERVEVWLRRYGMWLIFVSRFLSGLRSVVALSAGITRLPWARVMTLGLASMAMWNGVLLYVGMVAGENWESLLPLLKQYNRLVLTALVAIVALLWMRSRYRAKRG